MGNELQLVSDGNGLAVIGNSTDIDRFFTSHAIGNVPSKNLDLKGLGRLLGTGSSVAQVGAEFSANSSRWVKLTAESAEAVKEFGLMATKTKGVSHAMIGDPGDIKKWLQIAQAPGALLAGPMVLSSLATMMSQQAMQQQMDEITEYLAEIDEKVEDILRAQKDSVYADMIGVDLIVKEALTVRDQVGRVSEVTWSKVDSTSLVIARTQGYALRQIQALAEKLEKVVDLGEIAKATRVAEPKVHEWLAVLALCFQLQDGVSVLELDRVLDTAPEELDDHRTGLDTARQNRLAVIAGHTASLLARMDEAVRVANTKVLLNPFDSPAVVRSSNKIADGVLDFRGRLGIESGHETTDARRWGQAAADVGSRVLAAGAEGGAAAKRFGDQTFDQASAPFRSVDIDGDGIPDRPRAAAAAEEAGVALKGAAAGITGAIGTLFQRKQRGPATVADGDSEPSDDVSAR